MLGAIIGLLTAVLLLGMGAVRAMLAILGGARIDAEARDLLVVMGYLGIFALTGAVVGLLRARQPTKARTQLGFAIAGGVGTVLFAQLVAFMEERAPSHDPGLYLMLFAFGAFAGLILGTFVVENAGAPEDTP